MRMCLVELRELVVLRKLAERLELPTTQQAGERDRISVLVRWIVVRDNVGGWWSTGRSHRRLL